MARNLTAKADKVFAFRQMKDDLAKIEKQAREMREEFDKCKRDLIKDMGASTVATIDGVEVFKVVDTARRSTSIKLVEEHAPHLAGVLIIENTTQNIKFV